MSIDDMSALGLSGDGLNQTASGTFKQWQFTVDMIYRCLICGLISAGPLDEWLNSIGHIDVKSFVKSLADVNPFDRTLDPGHWIDTYFEDTIFCRLLVAHYGLLNANIAERTAENNLRYIGTSATHSQEYDINYEVKRREAARHLLECATISRAAGWSPEKDTDILEPAFIKEIEALFEKHGVSWDERALVPIRKN
jgi:hypothetical protein